MRGDDDLMRYLVVRCGSFRAQLFRTMVGQIVDVSISNAQRARAIMMVERELERQPLSRR